MVRGASQFTGFLGTRQRTLRIHRAMEKSLIVKGQI